MNKLGRLDSLNRPINWIGPLAEIPLAEVAKRVAGEKRSGDLQVIVGDTIKAVYFDRGISVGAASNLETDRLGETLVEQGRLRRHELAEAMHVMKDRGVKLGRSLVESGMMSETELEKRLTRQAASIVRSMFAAEDGIYSFDERACPIASEEMLSIPLALLILEGTRQITNTELITSWLPPPDEMLGASASYTTTVPAESLSSLECDVLQTVKSGASLRSVLQRVGMNRREVLHACYGLYSANLLEPLRETPLLARFKKEVGNARRAIDLLSHWALAPHQDPSAREAKD